MTSHLLRAAGLALLLALGACGSGPDDPPVADAGADQTAVAGTLVTLDGSQSSGPDGASLSYQWQQESGLAVTLTDADDPHARFTSPAVAEPTNLLFRLTVRDASGSGTVDFVAVQVVPASATPPPAPANRAPNAAIIATRPLTAGTTGALSGFASADPDGDTLAFAWTQIGGPAVALSGAQQMNALFTAPATATTIELRFRLTVSDGRGGTDFAETTVPVTPASSSNRLPLAAISAPATAISGAAVSLSSAGSSDPDGDALSFDWAQVAGSPVTLSGAGSATASFTAPTVTSATSLTFRLTVADGKGGTAFADATVQIAPPVSGGGGGGGGGGGSGGTSNLAPLISFSAPASAASGTSVSFSGIGSIDPDGDTLGYAWAQTAGTPVTFAGANAVNASFTAPTVTSATTLTFRLTVTDGRGGIATADFAVQITPSAGGGGGTPTVAGSITGKVVDTRTGAQLQGATVKVGTLSTTTDAEGDFVLEGVPTGDRVQLVVSKANYETNHRIVPVAANAESFASVVLLPIGASQTLDPAAGGNVGIAGSPARVSFAPHAINATGTVRVTITDVNPSAAPDNMPGDFTTAGAPIESFGALSVNLYKADGSPASLSSGAMATLRIPLDTRSPARPATIPLFFYDTTAGRWVEQGTATLQSGPDGAYYEGTVSHFTYWNADQVYNTVTLMGCVQDADGSRVAGVRLQSVGIDYTGTSTATSGADGSFSIPVRASSSLTIGGYLGLRLTSTQAVTTTSAAQTLPSCLQLGANDGNGFTVTLTWGQQPRDIDSHLLTPEGRHIYFGQSGSLLQEPFVNLDVDDTSSFGPEVITVLRPRVGTYRYFVHNYSGTPSPGISISPARVELRANGLTRVFTPPAGETASTEHWTVFDISIAANCSATVSTVSTPWSSDQPTRPQAVDTSAPFCSRN